MWRININSQYSSVERDAAPLNKERLSRCQQQGKGNDRTRRPQIPFRQLSPSPYDRCARVVATNPRAGPSACARARACVTHLRLIYTPRRLAALLRDAWQLKSADKSPSDARRRPVNVPFITATFGRREPGPARDCRFQGRRFIATAWMRIRAGRCTRTGVDTLS